MTNQTVTVYTDGGCSPNPGPGGWAAILLFPGQEPQELVGAEPDTTNNQMELRAAIEALKALPTPHQIDLYTDSQYLRQGITEWLPGWEERGWRTSQKTAVKNQDLWQELAGLLHQHEVIWRWTKGHAGDKWNERADELARSAIPRAALPLDDENAIHLFTAASYLGKQKRGGWAVTLRFREIAKTLSGTATNASGNRMHLQAAIEGLRAIKRARPIHLYTTSGYLKDGATLWAPQWQNRGWQTKEGKPVSNRDLWETLAALTQNYRISWHVVEKERMPPEMAQTKKLASEAANNRD
jgi:ribonuclease HI